MKNNRDRRLKLISQIEALRGSKVIVYYTSHGRPFPASIAVDAVLPLYKQLLSLEESGGKVKKFDLFLFTQGGDVSVPWRIVTMIREFCDEFSVLIPYKAYSAGTMITLGSDKIVMGRKAELSPIDPTLVRATVSESNIPPREISVEDVSSYISFMRERAGITDQEALSKVVSQLAAHLTPLTLGTVNRQYSHIRLVARKLISSRKSKIDEDRIASIIEALTEKMYSHGHAIGRQEAIDLGLHIEKPKPELEDAIWSLYLEYEDGLFGQSSFDPEEELENTDEEQIKIENIPLAVIESTSKLDVFEINTNIMRNRQIPPNPQLNINLNLGLPAGIDPTKIPEEAQKILQQIMGEITQNLPKLIQEQIVKQSPVIGVNGRTYGGRWKEKKV